MKGLNFGYEHKKKNRKKIVLYSLLGIFVAFVIFFFLNVLLSYGKIAPGVKIADTPIGGIDKEQAKKVIDRYVEKLSERAITIVINRHKEEVIPKDVGIEFLKEEMLKDALGFKKSLNPIKYIKESFISEYNIPIRIRYDDKRLQDYYKKLKEKYETSPINARLKGKKKIIREIKGLRFKTTYEEFVNRFINAAIDENMSSINIDVVFIDPEVTFKKILEKLRLNILISSYKTSIKEKEEGSRYNVLLAAKKIDGTILEQGEEFSYNKIVGPAEKDDGFQKGLVIVGGKFVPGYGGGVCQTSSTLYNAVLLAGLKVLERYNHSVYADATSYVPLGRDAAVYYGHKDLRFKNTLPYPIVIAAYQDGDYLNIEIWGRERPKAKYTIITRGKEVISYKTIAKKDSNLPEGKEIIEREGINGYRIKTYLEIEENGNKKEILLSNDYYRPIDKIIRVGK